MALEVAGGRCFGSDFSRVGPPLVDWCVWNWKVDTRSDMNGLCGVVAALCIVLGLDGEICRTVAVSRMVSSVAF